MICSTASGTLIGALPGGHRPRVAARGQAGVREREPTRKDPGGPAQRPVATQYRRLTRATDSPAPGLARLRSFSVNRELSAAQASAEIVEKLATLGITATAETPDAFATRIKTDLAKCGKVVKAAGIRAA